MKSVCDGPGNRKGSLRWYACVQCGKEKPETDFRVIHGTREKYCKGCKSANQNRGRALTRAAAVVPWPVIVKQYELSEQELAAVERAARLMGTRAPEDPTPDAVLREVAADALRQIQLAGAVCFRAKEIRNG